MWLIEFIILATMSLESNGHRRQIYLHYIVYTLGVLHPHIQNFTFYIARAKRVPILLSIYWKLLLIIFVDSFESVKIEKKNSRFLL